MTISVAQAQLFFLALTRILAVLIHVPVLGGRAVPNQIKIALGVPSRAVPHYEALLAADPLDADAAGFLRSQYAREGRHEARLELEACAAHRLEPEEASGILQTLATDAEGLELLELSRRLLIDAYSLHPADGALLARLTRELEPHGAWEPLLAAWRKRLPLILKHQEKVRAGLKIADYLIKLGDLEGAQQVYRGLQRADPELPEALEGLARILEEQGDWAGAVEMLERQSRLVTGEARATIALQLSRIYARHLHEPDSAHGWCREALAEAPGDARAIKGLLELLETRGDWQGMAVFLKGQLALQPESGTQLELLQHLGDIYLVHLKNLDQAMKYFKMAEDIGQAPMAVKGPG